MQAPCPDAMSTLCGTGVEPGWNQGGTGVEPGRNRGGKVRLSHSGSRQEILQRHFQAFLEKKKVHIFPDTHTHTHINTFQITSVLSHSEYEGKKQKKKTKVQLGVFAVSLVKH